MNRTLAVLLAAAALGACATANVAVNRNFDFSRVHRVAVLSFKDYRGAGGSGDLVTGAFEQSLIKAGYDVVERDQVAKVVKEQKFTGSLDARAAKNLGKILGVDALVLGQITDLAEPRTTVMKEDLVEDRSEPVYGRRTRRVENPDGTYSDVTETVITGYKTTHRVTKQPTSVSVSGRLGVSARMVFVESGGVLWSGTDSEETTSFADASQDIADDILKAVKFTWPVGRAK